MDLTISSQIAHNLTDKCVEFKSALKFLSCTLELGIQVKLISSSARRGAGEAVWQTWTFWSPHCFQDAREVVPNRPRKSISAETTC